MHSAVILICNCKDQKCGMIPREEGYEVCVVCDKWFVKVYHGKFASALLHLFITMGDFESLIQVNFGSPLMINTAEVWLTK